MLTSRPRDVESRSMRETIYPSRNASLFLVAVVHVPALAKTYRNATTTKVLQPIVATRSERQELTLAFISLLLVDRTQDRFLALKEACSVVC